MAYKPVVEARIEQLLTSWRAEQPAFFWAPTRPENLLYDQQGGLVGITSEPISFGGLVKPLGGGANYISFPSVFGIGANSQFFCMVLVWIKDPQNITGSFFKFGGPGSGGIAFGAGNTTFEDYGSKLIILKEDVAWIPGSNNSFVPGLNVISFYNTSEGVLGATNITSSADNSTVLTSYNAPGTNVTTINGQGANRESNAVVCAVGIWPTGFTNSQVVDKRNKLAAPLTGLARQYHKPWFTPRRIPEPIAAASGTVALTGNSATSAVGTLTPSISVGITGNATTSARGSFTLTESKDLTGNQVTASRGTPVASISIALTGNQVTASQGTVTPAGTFSAALTGNQVTASRGTVTPSITVAITGNQATANVGVVSPPGNVTVALTGVAATSAVGTILLGISKAITGNFVTSAVGTVAPVSGNVVALTGNQATSAIGLFTQNITIALTGCATTASIGTLGIGGWQQIDDSQTPNWAQIVDTQTPNWIPI